MIIRPTASLEQTPVGPKNGCHKTLIQNESAQSINYPSRPFTLDKTTQKKLLKG